MKSGQGRGNFIKVNRATGGSASIDITINSSAFLSGVSANTNIDVQLEGGTPVGVDVAGIWTILTSELITDLTDAQVAAIYSGRVSMSLVEYTADDTYSKPSNLMWAMVLCLGGGGGGGSGRRGAALSSRRGGGGGGGGALAKRVLQASQLAASETVTVGQGGAGGALVSTNDTNGNNGTSGTDSSFGTLVVAKGGLGGDLGAAAGAPMGGEGGSLFSSTPNAFPQAISGCRGGNGGTTGVGQVASSSLFGFLHLAAGSGGGGGSINTSNTVANGGNGSQAYDDTGALSTAAAGGVGAAGANGVDNYSMQLGLEYPIVPTNSIGVGTGGGGGSGGFAGGNGGVYGAGGGGAGGTLNGGTTGAGGDGADGFVIVVEFLAT